MKNVGQRLQELHKENPDAPAFIFRGIDYGDSPFVMTRSDVYVGAVSFAEAILQMEIHKGDVVCNTLPNSPERVISDFGLMLAGCPVLGGIHYLLDCSDMIQCMNKTHAVALIADSQQENNVIDCMGDLIIRQQNCSFREVPSLAKVVDVQCGVGHPWLNQMFSADSSMDISKMDVSSDSTAYIFSEAGSAGLSSVVSKTHRQLLALGLDFKNLLQADPYERVFNKRPIGRLDGCYLEYLGQGLPRVLIDMSYIPPEIKLNPYAWEICKSEECQTAVFTPGNLSQIISLYGDWSDDIDKIKRIVTGGHPVSKDQVMTSGMICEELVISYFTTETGFVTKNVITKDNKRQFVGGDVGKTLPNVQICIIRDSREIVHPDMTGVHGELLVGHNTGTSQEISTWIDTNTIAYYSPQQNLHIICQKYNVIMHGPYRLHPDWLERKLEQCDGVKKIVIVPAPSSKHFQELCICVLLNRTICQLEVDAQLKKMCVEMFPPDDLSEFNQLPKHFVYLLSWPTKSPQHTERQTIIHLAMENLLFDKVVI